MKLVDRNTLVRCCWSLSWAIYQKIFLIVQLLLYGKIYKSTATVHNKHRIDDWTPQTAWFDTTFAARKARYVKVFVKRPGDLPHWHPGAGYPAFFFIDEIVVR